MWSARAGASRGDDVLIANLYFAGVAKRHYLSLSLSLSEERVDGKAHMQPREPRAKGINARAPLTHGAVAVRLNGSSHWEYNLI